MKNVKECLSAEIIELMVEEGYKGFLKFTKMYSLSEVRKNGEILLYLLKIGFNPLDIDELLDIRSVTIERRILEYLREKEKYGGDTYEDFKFIFEKIKGLKYFDIYKRFIFSDLNEYDFCKREGITKTVFNALKERLDFKGVKKYEDKISEEKTKRVLEEKQKRKAALNPVKKHSRYGCVYIKLS